MAATKSTKTKSTKTAGKTKAKSSTASAKKTKKATSKKTSKSSTTKTARKKTTKKATKNLVNAFLTDVVKQANKVQKKAQAETKVWIKKLNAQDKQLAQLTKKSIKAKGKSKTSLDKKMSKLQTEMSATRTGLLAAENSMDKVATFVEWTTQLNAKPAASAYLPTSTSRSRPTLVSGSSKAKGKSEPKYNPAPSYEEEYPEENDEMNFLFGEDDDEEVNR